MRKTSDRTKLRRAKAELRSEQEYSARCMTLVHKNSKYRYIFWGPLRLGRRWKNIKFGLIVTWEAIKGYYLSVETQNPESRYNDSRRTTIAKTEWVDKDDMCQPPKKTWEQVEDT